MGLDVTAYPRAMATLREQFVVNPPSDKIAAGMNVEGRTLCYHGRAPCIMRCGVHWDPRSRTVKPIPEDIRLDWIARVSYLEDPAAAVADDLRSAPSWATSGSRKSGTILTFTRRSD